MVYGVTPEKPGLVIVTKRDGMKVKRTAIGVFPHDVFGPGDTVLVYEVTSSLLKVTRGLAERRASFNK